MKNNTETKRIALAVHFNTEQDYISGIYSWLLPDEIETPSVGDIIEVENLDETEDVVFIAETLVPEEECTASKKVLSVSKTSIAEYLEYSEIYNCNEIKHKIDVLAEGIKRGVLNPDDFSGDYLRGDWQELDPIYEALEEFDGVKRMSKRVALCVYVDAQYYQKATRVFAYDLPEEIQNLQFGQTLLLREKGEELGALVFIAEDTITDCKKRKSVVGVSEKTLEDVCAPYDFEEIRGALEMLLDGIRSKEHSFREFPGFNISYGWWSWDAEENSRIIDERCARRQADNCRKMRELRRRARARFQKENRSTKYRVKKISPEEIAPYRLYIEVDAESGQYKTSEKYPLWYAKYFFLVHNCKGEIGECIRGDAQIIETELGFLCDIPFGNGKIPKEICLRNPVKIDGFKKNSLFFEFIEDEEKFLDGFVHNHITLLSETEKSFTLSDGTKCRFVPALENMKIFPWMSPDDDRVIHQLKYKNTKWLCESQLDEARRHLADDGQVYILEVLQEMAGKLFWDTVIQTTYCHRYCTPRIFNATSSKKEAFEEVARFATAYVYQNGVNQYKDIGVYQEFWYSPGNYSDYNI